MGRRGTIVRIELKQFGTYNHIEIFPKEHLNIIIGPNGTGKSTIISAIILGLNGKAKLIGRATNIGDYVKSNCTEAEIIIEMDSGDNSPNPVIKRWFNTSNQTKWSLGNEKVTLQRIMDVISEYNIQIDNLCQFLPQDRVQDFSKMDSIELLVNTQRSVCSNDEVETYETLIKAREAHKEKEKRITHINTRTRELADANEKISNAVGILQEMEQLKEQLKNVRAKLYWSKYDEKQKKVVELKEKRIYLMKIVEEGKKLRQSITSKITSAETKLQKLQSRKISEETVLNQLLTDIENKKNEVDYEMMKINNIIEQTQKIIEEEKNRANKILTAKTYSDKLKMELESKIEEHGEENQIEIKMKELLEKISGVDEQNQQLKNKNNQVTNFLNNLQRELEKSTNQKKAIENMKNVRLKKLEQTSRDAYSATIWLRNNKDKFRKKIYEPIVMEVNFTSPDYAKYIEAAIPARDRCMFICEDVADMNLFLHTMRREKNLIVNAAHSGDNIRPFHKFKPSVPLDTLKDYGFKGFLSEIIKAPEPIMKYLCQLYGIHNVPFGNENAAKYADKLPQGISQFYCGLNRYSVKISFYSKNKLSMVTQINPNAQFFSMSHDEVKMKSLNEAIEKQVLELKNIQNQIQKIEQQIQNNRSTREQFMSHRKELSNLKQSINTARFRYEKSLEDIEKIERNQINVEEEIRKRDLQIAQIFPSVTTLIDKRVNLMKKYKLHHDNVILMQMEINLSTRKLEEARELERNYESTNMDNENNLVALNNTYKTEREVALQLFADAKLLTDNLTPNCPEFERFNIVFNQLPEECEVLDNMAKELDARVSCINTTDRSLLEQYQTRRIEIEQFQKEKEKFNVDELSLLNKIKVLKKKWLTSFEAVVAKINENVQRYFNYLGFSGQVAIKKGENELDFDQYGLSISVSFREGEPQQELNRNVQSGGERAVSTAIYMLSLQNLSRVPFRCVDEINQGMDAVNERKIFELITKLTNENDSSQYFYLTPKLLPGLKYQPKTTVHCIHNGPYECERPSLDSSVIVENIKRRSIMC